MYEEFKFQAQLSCRYVSHSLRNEKNEIDLCERKKNKISLRVLDFINLTTSMSIGVFGTYTLYYKKICHMPGRTNKPYIAGLTESFINELILCIGEILSS